MNTRRLISHSFSTTERARKCVQKEKMAVCIPRALGRMTQPLASSNKQRFKTRGQHKKKKLTSNVFQLRAADDNALHVGRQRAGDELRRRLAIDRFAVLRIVPKLSFFKPGGIANN